MIVSLYIGSDKLDLFKDETIELNSSVQDVNDITKNTTDFTQNFSVPASEINNTIFKHYYDATLDNGFDARTKVDGSIKVDGLTYKYGKFRLSSVKVKQGKASSYSIVFFGNLVSLVDLVKTDELSSLDLSAYNHEYSSANVLTGLQSGLFSNKIVYPLFAKKQYYYNSDVNDNVNVSNLANIAFNGGTTNGILWSDLRPSIALLPIIEAIETKYNIVFSRDFFGREEFTKLYLWINEKTEKAINGGEFRTVFNATDDPRFNLVDNEGTYPSDTYNKTTVYIYPEAGYENTIYTFKKYNNGEVQVQSTQTGNKLHYDWDYPGGDPNTIAFAIECNTSFKYTAVFTMEIPHEGFYVTTSGVNIIGSDFYITNNLPKLKIIDFLKGLFNMFKLIVIQDNYNGTIYVNTLKDYYAAGKVYNITEYVNHNSHDIQRGELLSEIIYKFEDPTTILNTQFKKNVGQGYGDEQLKLEGENGKPLDGGTQDYKVPFEQIVYERLLDINDNNADTNIMYGAIIDEETEPANPKPHIHYVANNQIGAKTISFINDSGTEIELTSTINVPSHTLGFESPQFSTVFGKEINEYSREIINNTLFSNYHKDYITSIFNFKRRTFKYEAFLPLRVALKLQLNDVLQIHNQYFRINKLKWNLITGKTSFELINSFDNTINGFSASRSNIITDASAKVESIFVTNLVNYSFIVNDLGDGTTWLNSVTNVGANIYFDIAENTTGVPRSLSVTFTNTDTLQELTITITQNGGTITFGSTTILWGNTTITFNN